MNQEREFAKIRLWAVLHGMSITDLISAKNCRKYCQDSTDTCRKRRRNWAQIIGGKLNQVNLAENHKYDEAYEKWLENDELDWTCIDFIYYQK